MSDPTSSNSVPRPPVPFGEAGADFGRSLAGPKDHAVIEQQLRARLRDAPAALASLAGPDHLVTVANDLFRQLFGGRPLVGLALRTALPELADQPFFPLLDETYRTGLASYGHEAVAYADPAGHRGPLYFTFMAQAVRDATGSAAGLLLFAYNVSAHVLARASEEAGTPPPTATAHELDLANEELATSNEELATTTEELLVSNEELATTVAQLSAANARLQASNTDIRTQAQALRLAQKNLRQLNLKLEARVAERTWALRHAQAEAEATAQQLRHVTESLPGISFTVDQAGQILYISPQWYAYTGMGPGVDVTTAWSPLIHPADLPGTVRAFGAALAAGGPWHCEFRLRGVDGHYRWFLSQAQIGRTPDGHLLKWYGTNTDVHQQRQLTEELARREEQLRFLTESLPQMVWSSTSAGDNDYVNQRWFDYTGLLATETDKQANWGSAVHPDDLAPTLRRWQQCVATGEFFEIEYRFRRHDGIYRWFLGQGRPQRHPDGHIIKWFGTCTDIDDQKRTRQQLEIQNARLVRSNEDLDNFIYTASHDLKQPITNIEGLLTALCEELVLPPAQAKINPLLDMMQGAVERFKHTIDQLTTVVKLQAAHDAQPSVEVDLAALVADVRQDLQANFQATGAGLIVEVAGCAGLAFPEKNLRSIVYNLLSNALKYRHPERVPQLRLRCHLAGAFAVLEVQDNGLGLDLAQQKKLFGLFQRLHVHVEGTGIGLYMVKKIVDNAGGRIEVESQLGVGSTFRLYLPHSH